MTPIKPQAQYLTLSEADVLKALEDPDPANAVAWEIVRLIEGYGKNFREHVEQLGYIPDPIAQSGIERVAMRLITKAFQKEMNDSLNLRGRGDRHARA